MITTFHFLTALCLCGVLQCWSGQECVEGVEEGDEEFNAFEKMDHHSMNNIRENIDGASKLKVVNAISIKNKMKHTKSPKAGNDALRCVNCSFNSHRHETEIGESSKNDEAMNDEDTNIKRKRMLMAKSSFKKNSLHHWFLGRHRWSSSTTRKHKRSASRPHLHFTVPENATGIIFTIPKVHPDERFVLVPADGTSHDVDERNAIVEKPPRRNWLKEKNEGILSENNWEENSEMGDKDLEVNMVSGAVSVKKGRRLDYESRPLINVSLLVTRASDLFFRSNQTVSITVEDVNDELPVFINRPHPFLAAILPGSAAGTTVYHLVAEDADEGSEVRYFIQADGDDGQKKKAEETADGEAADMDERSSAFKSYDDVDGSGDGDDLFELDNVSGVVRTKTNLLLAHKEYHLDVYARDMAAEGEQMSGIERLSVLVGVRKAQFHAAHYAFDVSEAAVEGTVIGQVAAVSHTGNNIIYELTESNGHTLPTKFSVDPTNGTLFLTAKLDYEKTSQPFFLIVKAVDQHATPLTASVEVEIKVTDVNDNPPTFDLSQFIVQNVPEDIPIGSQILKISVKDEDSGLNAEVDFVLSDDHFSVHSVANTAHITVAKNLDYDLQASHTYSFTISVSDRGDPRLSGSANIMLIVTNVNDHPPTFSNPVEHIQVSEDAFLGTVVHVVQAYDVDGDGLTYSFPAGRLLSGPFEIAPDSGILTLRRALDKQATKYFLNISATDDGSCCGGFKSLSSQGVVVVEVKDVNNNAPTFPLCSAYSPTVNEKENIGTIVIQVTATDNDTGDNCRLTYSLVRFTEQSSFDKFEVDSKSGLIVTTDILDRESKSGLTDYGITVKAEDHGSPSLAGFCSFRIKIGDKNDNAPIFSMSEYTLSVEESIPVNKKLKQIYATDRDSGRNSEIVYFIKNSSDSSHLFHLHPSSGWISVAQSLLGYKKISFEIIARDKGDMPLSSEALVTVEILQQIVDLPRWEEDSTAAIHIAEDVPVNYIVARFKATSAHSNMSLNYVISPGDSPEHNGAPITFFHRHDHLTNEMVLMTYRTLDFESVPKYILNIKAANRAMYSMHVDRQVLIQVLDSNDEIPQFVGLDDNGRYSTSVAENLKPGVDVIRVVAADKDTLKEYRQISYEIKAAGEDYNKFHINSSTGAITTLVSFDRETKSQYFITVVAKDGAPSSRNNHYPPGTPNQSEAELQVKITDTNDNPPFFAQEQYKIRIPENTKQGSIISTITAHDLDQENVLTYSITFGNVGKMFEVVPETGEIKVRGQLDYEEGPKVYKLTYRVFDDKFAKTARVVVSVLNVNDNPPTFESLIYTVENVTEEDHSISPQQSFHLLTVRATDVDALDETDAAPIKYSLMGQFVADKTFVVDENTGRIFLTRPIDRDFPNGREVYHFNVLAHDGKLTGYAEVKVVLKDVNDNAPVFARSKLYGSVRENSPAGQSVMLVTATDSDSGLNSSLYYSLKNVPTTPSGAPIFAINRDTGLVKTLVSDLDREAKDEYWMEVVATDRGINPRLSASASIMIKVDDANDHSPTFRKFFYQAEVQENLPVGAFVATVTATDEDIGVNAKLSYRFLYPEDGYYFSLETVEHTNYGTMRIKRNIDYESLHDKQFNLTVVVHDLDPNHQDTCQVMVKVTDTNDNAPSIFPSHHELTILESTQPGIHLFKFNAEDDDSGINGQFRFQLGASSDEEGLFSISADGLVSTKEGLDRECEAEHQIAVVAVDSGFPALTGHATLKVTLKDVNDNPPRLSPAHQQVVIMESQPIGTFVAEVTAQDADSDVRGTPFQMTLPCYGSCPCWENPACDSFSFTFIPEGGPKREGSALIKTRQVLDREVRKQYLMPIIMTDSGVPPVTGTSTLTITVGDINDHVHKGATKHVHLLTHFSQKSGVHVGRAYVEDADDWDLADKTFSFASHNDHFRIDEASGRIYTHSRSIPPPSQSLWVEVYDIKHDVTVTSLVKVHVTHVSRRAVANHASVRMQGTTAEEFTRKSTNSKSPMDDFITLISEIHKLEFENVVVLNVLNCVDNEGMIDVFYTIISNQPPSPEKLNGLLAVEAEKIIKKLHLNIVMAPTNLCLAPLYHTNQTTSSHNQQCTRKTYNIIAKDCFAGYVLSDVGHTIDNNATSFTAIGLYQQTKDTCLYDRMAKKRAVTFCEKRTCLHGGKCLEEDGRVSCFCLKGYSGPFCEMVAKLFKGDGFMWLPSINTCKDLHISLEVLPRHVREVESLSTTVGKIEYLKSLDGKTLRNHSKFEDYCVKNKCSSVLFYQKELNAKIKNNGLFSVSMTLEHDQFVVRLQKHGGNDGIEMRADGGGLYDGAWHQVDLFINNHYLKLVVDRCSKTHGNKANKHQSTCSSLIQFYEDNDIHQPLGRAHSTLHHHSLKNQQYHHQFQDPHHSQRNTPKHQFNPNHKMLFRKRENIILSSGPLQLGGMYRIDDESDLRGFDGCIRNFKVNQITHDLHTDTSTMQANVHNGCSEHRCYAKAQKTKYKLEKLNFINRSRNRFDSNRDDVNIDEEDDESVNDQKYIFKKNEDDHDALNDSKSRITESCLGNTQCVASEDGGYGECVCRPGWQGVNCLTPTPSADFHENSYIGWQLHDYYHNLFSTNFKFSSRIELMFRTRKEKGQLIRVQNNNKSRFILITIVSGHLLVTYNFHGSSHTRHHLSLSHVRVSDGLWHSVKVVRKEDFVEVSMDWGDGFYSNNSLRRDLYDTNSLKKRETKRNSNNESRSSVPNRAGFVVAKRGGVYVGADVKLVTPDGSAYIQDDFSNGCMKDVRLNGFILPLFAWQSSEIATISGQSSSVLEGCHSDEVCGKGNKTSICTPPFVCVERWRKAECLCPKDERPFGERQCTKKQDIPCSQAPDCASKCGLSVTYRESVLDLSDNHHYQEECLCGDDDDTFDDDVSCFSISEPLSSSTTTRLLLFVFLSIIFFIIVAFLLIMIFQRRLKKEKLAGMGEMDKYGSLREKVVHYNEEGIGEQDAKSYDLLKLKTSQHQRPIERTIPPPLIPFEQDLTFKSKIFSLTDLLAQKLQLADNDPCAPPFESVRQYRYEGRDSLYGSFSSLGSCQPVQRLTTDATAQPSISPYPTAQHNNKLLPHFLRDQDGLLS